MENARNLTWGNCEYLDLEAMDTFREAFGPLIFFWRPRVRCGNAFADILVRINIIAPRCPGRETKLGRFVEMQTIRVFLCFQELILELTTTPNNHQKWCGITAHQS